MGRVEPAGERAERGQDQLGLRDDETAPRDLPALEVEPELGVKMARHFGPRVVAHRLMAKDDAGDSSSSARRRRNGRKSPDRDCRRSTPSRARGHLHQQLARGGRQPVAAEAVVEAVAEAIEPPGAGALDLGRERGQGRVRIIGRQELPEPREPARFLEVQVGDQQRLLRRPVERASAPATKVSPANEKGTMP